MYEINYSGLQPIAAECALVIFGISPAEMLSDERRRLESWQRQVFYGDMRYMARPAELLSDPLRLLPMARSVVSFAAGYSMARLPSRRSGYGLDYHEVLKRRIQLFVSRVQEQLGRRITHRVFVDAVPLLERGLGARAGVGFVGKSTMLIRPGTGSFFFLGEVLWELEVSGVSGGGGGCGCCERCLAACPSGALTAERTLDARRCVAYLTIEKRGMLAQWERRALGEWLFGCDICQECCPFNHAGLKAARAGALRECEADEGVGPLLSLPALLEIRSEEEFARTFGGTALMRAGREGLLRNAAAVAANTKAGECVAALRGAAERDSSQVVREHARWALSELGER